MEEHQGAIKLFVDRVAQIRAKADFKKQMLIDIGVTDLEINIPDKLTADDIEKLLIESYTKLVTSTQTDTAATAAKEAGPDDPVVHIRFVYLEQPKGECEFAYNCPDGKARTNEVGGQKIGIPAQRWLMRSGVEYDVPMSLVRHLQRRQVPDYDPIIDPISGEQKGQTKTLRSRFHCDILLSDDQVRAVSALQKGGQSEKAHNSPAVGV